MDSVFEYARLGRLPKLNKPPKTALTVRAGEVAPAKSTLRLSNPAARSSSTEATREIGIVSVRSPLLKLPPGGAARKDWVASVKTRSEPLTDAETLLSFPAAETSV